MKTKNQFLTILALFFNTMAIGANYYFSATSGNDSRTPSQAQNPSTPWKSINKLNSIMNTLQSGDQVLFKRGEVFTGQITITVSGSNGAPIIFGAYGTGDKPVINAASAVTNWTNIGGNIWQGDFAIGGASVTGVYSTYQELPLGRWPNLSAPNKGYANIDSHGGNTSITSSQLSGAPTSNWTGGEAVYRAMRWVINKTPITSQSGNRININANASYGPQDDWGFFIQSHPATLDQVGEWYYNSSSKKIQLFSLSTPNNVTATAYSSCIDISNENYITIDNLTLHGSIDNNLFTNQSSNITLKNSKSINAGTNSIWIQDSDKINILYDSIINTHNNGITFQTTDNIVCNNNYIKRMGVIPGLGKSGDGNYEAISLLGYGGGPSLNATIQDNVLDSLGYLGIGFYGYSNVLVQNNFITHFVLTLDDGGGIYTYTGNSSRTFVNRKIIDNIVLNAEGAPEGTDDPNYIPAEGIYLDDNAADVKVTGNSIANCGSTGIFLHNAKDIDLKKNTVYNATKKQLSLAHDTYGNAITNCNITGNIFFSKTNNQLVSRISSIANDLNTTGIFDSNYYCRPFDDNLIITTSQASSSDIYSLESWQTALGQDQYSKKTPIQYSPFSVNNLIGANKFNNGDGTFENNMNGLYCWSPGGGCGTSQQSGKLDGKALAFYPNQTDLTILVMEVGQVSASKRYILKFSSKTNTPNKNMEIYLRYSNTPFSKISTTSYSLLDTNRVEYEILIEPQVNENNASITFEMNPPIDSVWFDNIEFYEANITMANPDDSIRFEYNATHTPLNVSLSPYTYIDVEENVYSGSVTLQPFTSIILLRTNTGTSCTTPSTPSVGTITHPDCSTPTGSVVLTGLPSSGSWTLTRTPGGTTTNGSGTSKTISGLAAGTYSYTVTNAGGCTSSASSNVVINSQPSTPTTPVINQNGNVLTSSALTGNQWYLNSNPISGAINNTYTATVNGTYTVIVTVSGCSSNVSLPLTVTTVGIDRLIAETFVSIYPNPFKATFTIEVLGEYEYQNMQVKLYDVTGKEVRSVVINNKKTTVERGNLSDGVYFYTINSKANIILKGKLIVK
ncbi:MAG: right-handed parallel beta-helix repeat-containing protein [Vicingus serpentipes]|nr:right-handed parallel beta-helix repeat-containing protein [Vicingus serpentipes]